MGVFIEWATHLKPMNNSREHPMARATRVKKQREVTHLLLKTGRVSEQLGEWPTGHRLVVTMIRIASRKLDPGDNHNSSFKSIRDEIASYFGVNDGDDSKIHFVYAPHIHGPSTARVQFHFETPPKEMAARVTETKLATTPKQLFARGLLKPAVYRPVS